MDILIKIKVNPLRIPFTCRITDKQLKFSRQEIETIYLGTVD